MSLIRYIPRYFTVLESGPYENAQNQMVYEIVTEIEFYDTQHGRSLLIPLPGVIHQIIHWLTSTFCLIQSETKIFFLELNSISQEGIGVYRTFSCGISRAAEIAGGTMLDPDTLAVRFICSIDNQITTVNLQRCTTTIFRFKENKSKSKIINGTPVRCLDELNCVAMLPLFTSITKVENCYVGCLQNKMAILNHNCQIIETINTDQFDIVKVATPSGCKDNSKKMKLEALHIVEKQDSLLWWNTPGTTLFNYGDFKLDIKEFMNRNRNIILLDRILCNYQRQHREEGDTRWLWLFDIDPIIRIILGFIVSNKYIHS
jgi:hypothetical protein